MANNRLDLNAIQHRLSSLAQRLNGLMYEMHALANDVSRLNEPYYVRASAAEEVQQHPSVVVPEWLKKECAGFEQGSNFVHHNDIYSRKNSGFR